MLPAAAAAAAVPAAAAAPAPAGAAIDRVSGTANAELAPPVAPGETITYRFLVPPEMGPSPAEPSAKLWLYRCAAAGWRAAGRRTCRCAGMQRSGSSDGCTSGLPACLPAASWALLGRRLQTRACLTTTCACAPASRCSSTANSVADVNAGLAGPLLVRCVPRPAVPDG